MRIWNEIELYKGGEKSRAFLANNLYCLKQGLAGVSHVEIYATGSQSQTHVTATAEMPMQSIRNYKQEKPLV